jgi:hypothetical protein
MDRQGSRSSAGLGRLVDDLDGDALIGEPQRQDETRGASAGDQDIWIRHEILEPNGFNFTRRSHHLNLYQNQGPECKFQGTLLAEAELVQCAVAIERHRGSRLIPRPIEEQ